MSASVPKRSGRHLLRLFGQSGIRNRESYSSNSTTSPNFPSKLEGARLEGADLSGADLVHADMRGASLAGTNLTATSLSGAKGLTQDQLDQACTDPDNPPKLDRAHDAKTGKPLEWHGQPCRELTPDKVSAPISATSGTSARAVPGLS